MDNLYEPSKKFCLKAVGILSIAAALFSFFPHNSKILFPALYGLIPPAVYELMLSLFFITLAVCTFIMNTAVADGKKKLELEAKRSEIKTFYDERDYNRKTAVFGKKMRRKNKTVFVLALISIFLILFVFCFAEIGYVIIIENKPEIDRVAENLDGFRLYVDLITYFAFVLGTAGYFITAPFIVRNRNVNRHILITFSVCDIVSIAHLTYFFMGNIMSYPSVLDGITALICLCFAMLGFLGIMTEEKKKLLSGWNETKINVYDF